ncbi:hypothetical protein J5N97_029814 [Dioscorea zingiberensis]|uniref:Fe2OG dioxygenase domain-containing protein n=1 Tax=Dioscorea zingiberensis TaxID=325984 RepID=A0A9D5BWE4_9LILI|nr:hypothetical protein J5N97_029814 [Dioscorea zingiberensis]
MAQVVSRNESWGKSIRVEKVQALADMIGGGGGEIPEIYIRPELDVGLTDQEAAIDDHNLPVIHMNRLLDPSFSVSTEESAKLDYACKEWGFFQLVNHGIDGELIDKMEGDLKEFFKLPLEEKELFAPLPGGLQGYGQKLLVNEEKLEWHDLLFLITQPLDDRNMKFWPTNPPTFRSTLERFSLELKRVLKSLFEVIGMKLGLKPEVISRVLSEYQGLRMHYYPPCPKASKVLGLNPHSDVGILTLLLQVGDVQGLQIKKNGKWLSVEAIQHALVVNVGDVLEILTNGKYISVEHRVTVTNKKERLSIAAHHRPKPDCMVGPLQEMLHEEEEHNYNYKTMSYDEYIQLYLSGKVEGKSHMNSMRANK